MARFSARKDASTAISPTSVLPDDVGALTIKLRPSAIPEDNAISCTWVSVFIPHAVRRSVNQGPTFGPLASETRIVSPNFYGKHKLSIRIAHPAAVIDMQRCELVPIYDKALKFWRSHAAKPAHISMITVDIAAPRPTATEKKRNGSKYHFTPVTPYQCSGSAAAECCPLYLVVIRGFSILLSSLEFHFPSFDDQVQYPTPTGSPARHPSAV